MFDEMIAELNRWIDRLAPNRVLRVSNDEVKFWTASIGDTVLYRSPDGAATLRFAHTFAERTAGVVVEVEQHSVRVGALPEREVESAEQSGPARESGSLLGGNSGGSRPTALRSSRSGSAFDNVIPLLGHVDA